MFINNLAYEASAGSGKTFMLVVRYLSLLFKGSEPSKILALTFTNKAASEMQERIVETLEDLQNRGELVEISKLTNFTQEYLLANRTKILAQFLNANTKIMTIDSFFTQILRKFSLYAALMPDFSTMNSQHELKLLSRFLKEVSVSGKKEILIKLSLQSNKRVTDIFELLEEFYVKKEELSGLKFSYQEYHRFEKEALENLKYLKEIIDRCEAASDRVKNAVDAQNFEELSAKSWIGKETLNYVVFSKCFTPVMDTYLRAIQEAIKNQNRAKEQNFFYALNELVEIYVRSKKALYIDESELSFSDVTSLVYQILHLIDDSEFLYFRLDAQIEHMLLDEFQDTSILQYKILKPLIDEIVSGNGIFNEGSFFFVGDVKQSIYRFRGGVSALFNTVKDECNTQVEKLLTNYRSKKEVVEFVNRIFIDKIKDYSSQKVKEGAEGGFVEVLSSDEVLEEAIKQVKRFIEIGAHEDDIAILCATNGDGESIKQALVAENIDVVTETTTKLIYQKSVKAVLEYLKYLYFRRDIYRYNFFALIERELQEVSFIDLNDISLVELVKRIITQYSLFENDFHLIRFLEVVSKQKDIEALLFEYERLDVSAAASDLSGVRVLTVHKSKGLEYKHVIVMDRLKRAPSSRDSIIYEYDGIELKNVYLRTKGREALDKEYANAIAKEKSLVREDSLNALYVAFTRAKENLIVITKTKESMFELIDLEQKSHGILEHIKEKKVLIDNNYEKLEYKALYYGTQSDILAQEEDKEEDLKSINFGLAMHYMLEMLFEFKIEDIPHAKDMMINKYGSILELDEIEDIEQRINFLVSSKDFLDLVDGECYKEKAIRYKNNLRYIDLLVNKTTQKKNLLDFSNDCWNVIDYKSSFNYSKHHIKQVNFYVQAIKKITNDEVNGYICYLLADGIKLVKI